MAAYLAFSNSMLNTNKKVPKSLLLEGLLWEQVEAYRKANHYPNASQVVGYILTKWFLMHQDTEEILWRIFRKTPKQIYEDTKGCGCPRMDLKP